jgi:adenosylmethionine-8-amino-7-oxononanoate aminotransferase
MIETQNQDTFPMDCQKNEVNRTSAHSHFAGRLPAGSQLPVSISKNGIKHVREINGDRKEIDSIGLACSECFSGPRLAQLLKPGFDYEQQVMMDLMSGKPASPLSIHTSGGVPMALSDFVNALEPHLPWKDADSLDWCVSLQLEGASAVWAAIDLLLQSSMLSSGGSRRMMVAVGSRSYHGPPSTSFGAKSPLWTKDYQLTYPCPIAGEPIDEIKLLAEFQAFLDKNGDDIGVLLVEPQWGSSQAALPWPKDLLKAYIKMAQDRGIKVLADEIMCGLGRHGEETMFLSEAWELNPDAITFGKAIGGGVYPLSGTVIKEGGSALGCNGRTVMQSHTYSGSSVRALMTAVEVLKTVPQYLQSISKLGDEMELISNYLTKISNGLMQFQGQGLMWGALMTKNGIMQDDSVRSDAMSCLKKNCLEAGVLPYFIPVGGFMISPVIDIDVGSLYNVGQKLEEAIKRTVTEVGWVEWKPTRRKVSIDILVPECQECDSDSTSLMSEESMCSTQLHFTKTCTSCDDFVCRKLRRRFSEGSLMDMQ